MELQITSSLGGNKFKNDVIIMPPNFIAYSMAKLYQAKVFLQMLIVHRPNDT